MRVYANLRIKRYKGGIPASIDFSPTRGKLYATLSVEEIRSASEKETRGRKDITSDCRRVEGTVIKRDERERESCKTVIAIAQRNSVVIHWRKSWYANWRTIFRSCAKIAFSHVAVVIDSVELDLIPSSVFNSLFFLFFRDILSYQYTARKYLSRFYLACINQSLFKS